MKRPTQLWLTTWLLLVGTVSLDVRANPGEDGTLTVTGAVTVNNYTTLSADAAAGATSIAVTNAGNLSLPACPGTCSGATGGNGFGTALAAGDLLLIYQPQETDSGAIVTTNDNTFGGVTTLGSAGLYEFVYVQSVATNTINIVTSANGASCTGLANAYDGGGGTVAGKAMVIRVPQLHNLNVNSGGIIQAPAWDGTSGGVVALDVRRRSDNSGGVLTFNGNGRISVTGLGFRGGARDNSTNTLHNTLFASTTCTEAARKGESIFGYSGTSTTDCTAAATGLHVGRTLGRGALANGGGGGNAHNAGGGGGANGGIGTWNGGGNPVSGFATQWNLDDQYLLSAGPTALTRGPVLADENATSTGGGRGGYTWGYNAATAARNPGVQGPQRTDAADNQCLNDAGANIATTARWKDEADTTAGLGNCRANVGGIGGRPLSRGTDNVQRFYFGGGGGAGDANNSLNADGGPGGGLIFVTAFSVVDSSPGTARLQANGGAAPGTIVATNNAAQDAPGGGGGGGTVVLISSTAVTNNMLIEAIGGAGGIQSFCAAATPTCTVTTTESEGPGGGGGGGVIALRTGGGSPVRTAAGGANGTTNAVALNTAGQNPFPPNGATRGGAGEANALGPPRSGPMFACTTGGGGGFTTPVSNAWFRAHPDSGSVRIEFSSAAEVANVGYFVDAESNGRRERASAFIAAKDGDPASPRTYEAVLADRGYTRYWITDVDARGKETTRGPFEPNVEYGSRPSEEAYDWSEAQADADRSRGVSGGDAAYLSVNQRGMYRVSHAQLLAANVDLTGVPVSELALFAADRPVPRAFTGGATFGPGSYLEFWGEPRADLHNSGHRYLLRRSQRSEDAIAIPVQDAALGTTANVSVAEKVAAHQPPRHFYDLLSPTGTPWYMYTLTASGAAPTQRDMAVTVAGPEDGTGTLRVKLYGGNDHPAGALPDHHVELLLNGQLVMSERFDGIAAREYEVPVTNIQAGANTVTVRLPADGGYSFDQVKVASVEIAYVVAAEVVGGTFLATAVQPAGELSDRMFADGIGDVPSNEGVFSTPQISIGGRSPAHSIWVVGARTVAELTAPVDIALSGAHAGSLGSTIFVADRTALPAPQIQAAPPMDAVNDDPAQYVVVSHPAFIPSLQPLLQHRQAQGLSTEVIDVEQLYRRYTAGNPHPEAILAYLREHAQAKGIRYLVLAGGANYNSVGLLPPEFATLSHVPTPYARINQLVNFAPGDAIYGDLTGDGVSEIAVGRLPARTVAEMDEVVRKLLAYDSQSASARITLVSGGADGANGLNFRTAVDQLAADLAPSWQQSRIDVDTLGAAGAYAALTSAIASGQSVISYTGHSAPAQWGFEPVLTASQVAGFAPNANQPVLLQFGCWTTYFLSPVSLTMGNAWMLSVGKGASAVFGSTVLLDQPNHDLVARELATRLNPGVRLGDAIELSRAALRDIGDINSGAEVMIGIALLGDPAMVIR